MLPERTTSDRPGCEIQLDLTGHRPVTGRGPRSETKAVLGLERGPLGQQQNVDSLWSDGGK